MSSAKKGKNIKRASPDRGASKSVVVSPDEPSKPPQSRFKRVITRTNLWYLVGLIIVVGVLSFFLNGGFHSNTVVIGKTKITQKSVNDFAQQLSDYQKSHPQASFGSNLNQYASDKLILNAALKLEAQKYGVTVSDDDLAQAGGQSFPNEQVKTAYFDSLRQSSNNIELINMENIAYQAKLQAKLLDQKQLTVVNLMLDTPYYRSLPQSQVQAAYNKAKTRMDNVFLPLITKGTSEQSIASKADIGAPSDNAPAISTAEDDAAIGKELALYNKQGVVSVAQVAYQKGITNFNDNNSTSWIRGNIGQVYQTSDKVDQLKNVGDNTGLFASKAGNYTIIRLDSKTGGAYDSWADFLNYYKDQYAKGKLQVAYTKLGSIALGLANQVTQTITAPGLDQAWADFSGSCNESDHQYSMSVVAWDSVSGAALSGGSVQFGRTPGTTFAYPPYKDADGTEEPGGTVTACGETGSFTITSNGTFTPQTNSTDTLGVHGNTFVDNCANTPLEFSINSVSADPNPGIYQPVYNSSTTNASWQHPNFDGTTGSLEDGFPDPPNQDNTDHIRPGLANTNTYTIVLRYTEALPSWTLSGDSEPKNINVAPGQSVPFTHTVTNNGPDPANYNWYVQESYDGGKWSNVIPPVAASRVRPGTPSPANVSTPKTPWSNPTSSKDGSTYCQRIVYTAANGPGNPPGGAGTPDTPACVTLQTPTTPVVTCYSAFVPAPKASMDALPPIPPDTSTGWSTSTTDNPIVGYVDVTITGTSATPAGQSSYEFKEGQEYSTLNVKSGPPTTETADSPETPVYVPTGNTVTVTYTYYEYALRHDLDSNGNRVYQLYQLSSTTVPLTCLGGTASNSAGVCSLTVTGGLGPGGVIIAGQQVNVSGTVYNPYDPAHPERITLPESLPNGDHLSLTFNSAEHDVGTSIPINGSAGVSLGQITANGGSDPSTQTISAYPDYYGTGPIGASCSTSFSVYAPFSLTPHAQVTLDPSTEDPTTVNNDTYVTETGTPVSENVTSQIYEVTAGGATIPHGNTSNGGPFSPSSTTCLYQSPAPYTVPGCNNTYNGQYAPSTPLKAGDTYCAEIDVPATVDPSDPTNIPYVGPSGDIVGGADDKATDCPKIVNEPFFKVYNSSVSAGSQLPPPGGGACHGGELAGWNDDSGTNPPSGDFGAGTQLNALAALGITGFASGQNVPPTLNGPPAALNLANTGPGVTVDSSIDSPHLGGNFGDTPCLTGQAPPQNSQIMPGSTDNIGFAISAGQHSYSYGTSTSPVNLTLTGGLVGFGDNVSIFVNGNVYIKSNVQYIGDNLVTGLNASWNSAKDVPSFTLNATGNIYIEPGVGELDGIYTAQADATGGGTIYTCSDAVDGQPFQPMPSSELYGGCNKQLTVYGTFMANHVNLMRTLGSLRDETPLSATTQPQTDYDYPVRLAQYSCNVGNMSNAYQHSHWYEAVGSGGNSLTLAPPLPTGNTSDQCPSPSLDGYDGYIFPPTDATFINQFLNGNYWLLCEDIDHISGGGGDHYVQIFAYNQAAACTSNGSGGTVLGYIPNTNVSGTTPLYENFDGSPHDVNPPHCFNNGCSGFHYLSVTDNLEEEGVWGYPYTSATAGEQPYTVQVAVPSQQPNPPTCSNPGTHSSPLPTCAAEVFDFSPELYLSNPAIQLPSNGALQLQAITSLPPVL